MTPLKRCCKQRFSCLLAACSCLPLAHLTFFAIFLKYFLIDVPSIENILENMQESKMDAHPTRDWRKN